MYKFSLLQSFQLELLMKEKVLRWGNKNITEINQNQSSTVKLKYQNKAQINEYMAEQFQKQYNNLVGSINKISYLLTKHDNIRLKHWLEKLSTPVANVVWRQNRNFYLRVLKQMINQGQLLKPFNQSPPEGPLPKMTIYDVPYPIRIKLIDEEHRNQKNTPSNHKNSVHSRKNSSASNMDPKRSLSKGSKNMEHRKKIVYDPMFQMQKNEEEKEQNNYQKHRKSLSGKLQDPKPLSKYYSLHETQNLHSTQRIGLREQLRAQQQRNEQVKKKGCDLLKKGLKFLGKYFEQFENSIPYKQVIEKIVEQGDRIGQNFRQVSIPSTEQSIYIDKYNQRIKDKLFQTDLNTIQFMDYLNSLV